MKNLMFVLLASVTFLLQACNSQKNASQKALESQEKKENQVSAQSENIKIAVQPAKAILLPAKVSSCLDAAKLKRAVLTASTSSDSNNSLDTDSSSSNYKVAFQNFSISWNSDSNLYVSDIRIKIASTSIATGRFQYDINGAELSSLLARKNNIFKGKADMINTVSKSTDSTTGTIYSNDPARDCSVQNSSDVITGLTCKPNASVFSASYAACGLEVGGIQITNVQKSFTAPVNIELIGYSVDSNDNQTLIHAFTDATISFDPL